MYYEIEYNKFNKNILNRCGIRTFTIIDPYSFQPMIASKDQRIQWVCLEVKYFVNIEGWQSQI